MPETGTTTPEQQRHLDVTERLDDIVKAILATSSGSTIPPIVNVTVDPPSVTLTPSQVVVRDKVYPFPTYLFTVKRNQMGFIESIRAEPENG